jgi:hypothetical protein
MAPSEFDLRAALRDGEGEGLNPDHIIFAVEQHRARRRSRLLTTAAVVALVTGGAVGISQLDGSGTTGTSDSAAKNAVNGAQGSGGLVYGAAGSPLASAAHSMRVPAPLAPVDLAAIACPTAAPSYSFSTRASLRSAASKPMFRTAVSAVVVCGYGSSADSAQGSMVQPTRLTLAGGRAWALARSLDHAAAYRKASCPARPDAGAHYAVIAVAPSGSPAGPTVSAQLGCNGLVTNGTAVRFNWSPPPELARRLEALNDQAVAGRMTPSPSPTG